jgi:hypothetical protein
MKKLINILFVVIVLGVCASITKEFIFYMENSKRIKTYTPEPKQVPSSLNFKIPNEKEII